MPLSSYRKSEERASERERKREEKEPQTDNPRDRTHAMSRPIDIERVLASIATAPTPPGTTRDQVLRSLIDTGVQHEIDHYNQTIPAGFVAQLACALIAIGDITQARFTLRRYAHITDPVLSRLGVAIAGLWNATDIPGALRELRAVTGSSECVAQEAVVAVSLREIRARVVSYSSTTVSDVASLLGCSEADVRGVLRSAAGDFSISPTGQITLKKLGAATSSDASTAADNVGPGDAAATIRRVGHVANALRLPFDRDVKSQMELLQRPHPSAGSAA